MQYTLIQSLLSADDHFTIIDETESPIYRVQGRPLAWGEFLSFQSMDGTELASISQEMESVRPAFAVHRDGQLFAEITKDFSWFRPKFTLDVPGPNDYTIKGSFADQQYTFVRQAAVVATASKNHETLSDTYVVDIVPAQDDVAILATVVVIDLINHNEHEV